MELSSFYKFPSFFIFATQTNSHFAVRALIMQLKGAEGWGAAMVEKEGR